MSSFKKLYIKKFYNFIKRNVSYFDSFNSFINKEYFLNVSFIKHQIAEKDNVKLIIQHNGIKIDDLFINYESICSMGVYDNFQFFIDVINYYSNDFLVIHLKTTEIKEIKNLIKNNMCSYFRYNSFKKLKN